MRWMVGVAVKIWCIDGVCEYDALMMWVTKMKRRRWEDGKSVDKVGLRGFTNMLLSDAWVSVHVFNL